MLNALWRRLGFWNALWGRLDFWTCASCIGAPRTAVRGPYWRFLKRHCRRCLAARRTGNAGTPSLCWRCLDRYFIAPGTALDGLYKFVPDLLCFGRRVYVPERRRVLFRLVHIPNMQLSGFSRHRWCGDKVFYELISSNDVVNGSLNYLLALVRCGIPR